MQYLAQKLGNRQAAKIVIESIKQQEPENDRTMVLLEVLEEEAIKLGEARGEARGKELGKELGKAEAFEISDAIIDALQAGEEPQKIASSLNAPLELVMKWAKKFSNNTK